MLHWYLLELTFHPGTQIKKSKFWLSSDLLIVFTIQPFSLLYPTCYFPLKLKHVSALCYIFFYTLFKWDFIGLISSQQPPAPPLPCPALPLSYPFSINHPRALDKCTHVSSSFQDLYTQWFIVSCCDPTPSILIQKPTSLFLVHLHLFTTLLIYILLQAVLITIEGSHKQ